MARRAARGQSTEVDAYVFIKDRLKILGWDTRNPTRHPTGQVYTQNECLSNEEIRRYLGLDKPENIVKISESAYWVIEAKREHSLLQRALIEAEDYATRINQSRNIQVKFITGIAGNDTDSYLIKNKYLHDGEFEPITLNGIESSGLLSPEEIARILRENTPNIIDVPINEKLFVDTAGRINEILHLGAVNPHQRANVMAALLLSLLDSTPPNIDAPPSVLINDINGRAQRILREQGKTEFYEYIRIALPATEDNHLKFKRALVLTLQELNNLNIRSALNSGTDVLGRFYEIFIKYANWAQDLGIVLTPRHITQFIAEVMNISHNDIVYDPTCGTGGFLVASFDYVKRNSNTDQLNKFKEYHLFGIEQDAGIVSLAIVNMIFRGDGKNNIFEGNCFSKFLDSAIRNGVESGRFTTEQSHNPPVNKVLMNPPFALKSSDEKEYKFVDYALKQMQDGGILFTILPYSSMAKSGGYLDWRNRILLNNTLLSVITFPSDLFYPIGVHAVGVFIKKGVPHNHEQKVLWLRTLNDGYLKSKGKRLQNPRATNDFPTIFSVLQSFLINQNMEVRNITKLQKAIKIDFTDTNLELVPEAYLDDEAPTVEEMRIEVEKIMKDTAAFMVKSSRE